MLIQDYWRDLYPAEPKELLDLLSRIRIIDASLAAAIYYKDSGTSIELQGFGSVLYNPLNPVWLEYTTHNSLSAGVIVVSLPIPEEYQHIAMEHNYITAAADHFYPFTDPARATTRVLCCLDGELPVAKHILLGHIWLQFKEQEPPVLVLGFGTYLDKYGRCRDERILLNDYLRTGEPPPQMVGMLFPMLYTLATLAQNKGQLRPISSSKEMVIWRLVPGINKRLL
ncbi:MAG: hypothetical protein GWN58_27845 [Anaerolineae bacterium]|nr:hypothetical protein [Anaerolineae bacterium]